MVHGIVLEHCLSVCPSVQLQILNSFNISGMDEAAVFKFGKWVEYGRFTPGVKNFPQKRHSQSHVTLLKF